MAQVNKTCFVCLFFLVQIKCEVHTTVQCVNVNTEFNKSNVVTLHRDFELSLSDGASDEDDDDDMPLTLPTDSSHNGSIRKVRHQKLTLIYLICMFDDYGLLLIKTHNSPSQIITLLQPIIIKSLLLFFFFLQQKCYVMVYTVIENC